MNHQEILNSALNHLQHNEINQAITAFKSSADQGSLASHVYLGWIYASEYQDWHQSISHYMKVLERYPQVAYNIAYAHQHLSQLDKAIYYYKLAIEANVAMAHIQLGYLFACLQDYTQAIMQYQIALFKGEEQANLLLGKIFEEMEDMDRAQNYYEVLRTTDFSAYHDRLFRLSPPGSQSHQRLQAYWEHFMTECNKGALAIGVAHQGKGQHLKALLFFQKAIEQGDERGEEHFSKLVFRYHNEEEKMLLLKEAIRENLTEAYYHLALVYFHQADYGNALLAIKRYNRETDRKFKKGVELSNEIFARME